MPQNKTKLNPTTKIHSEVSSKSLRAKASQSARGAHADAKLVQVYVPGPNGEMRPVLRHRLITRKSLAKKVNPDNDKTPISEIELVDTPAISPSEIATQLHTLAEYLQNDPNQNAIEPGELMKRLPPELRDFLGTVTKFSGRDVSSYALLSEAAKIGGVEPSAITLALQSGRLQAATLAGKRKVVSVFDVRRVWKNGGQPGRPRKIIIGHST